MTGAVYIIIIINITFSRNITITLMQLKPKNIKFEKLDSDFLFNIHIYYCNLFILFF